MHAHYGVPMLLTVGLLTACGNSTDSTGGDAADEPDMFTVTGEVTLISAEVDWLAGGECYGTSGYDDMIGGAQVLVRDADGKSVAVGELAGGVKEDRVTCRFPFTVDDVPSGSVVYSVEVAHRGEVSFTEADADDVSLSLG